MTVNDLARELGLRVFCMPSPEREVTGGYAGDLLSWVMGRASADCAWVTIMSNVNIVAVATLADPACIILSEGVVPDDGVMAKAESVGVNILGAEEDTFSVCRALGNML